MSQGIGPSLKQMERRILAAETLRVESASVAIAADQRNLLVPCLDFHPIA
jgi:hypothetical protein